jgi:hypothetical protein
MCKSKQPSKRPDHPLAKKAADASTKYGQSRLPGSAGTFLQVPHNDAQCLITNKGYGLLLLEASASRVNCLERGQPLKFIKAPATNRVGGFLSEFRTHNCGYGVRDLEFFPPINWRDSERLANSFAPRGSETDANTWVATVVVVEEN